MADTTLILSDLTADVNQFAAQFELYLQQKPTWVGNLTTQTSQTLIELISTVGAVSFVRQKTPSLKRHSLIRRFALSRQCRVCA
jgi:hypothetical protein